MIKGDFVKLIKQREGIDVLINTVGMVHRTREIDDHVLIIWDGFPDNYFSHSQDEIEEQ